MEVGLPALFARGVTSANRSAGSCSWGTSAVASSINIALFLTLALTTGLHGKRSRPVATCGGSQLRQPASLCRPAATRHALPRWPQAVPPTVSASMRSVGWPTPTGTLWPSLPQVPTPSSSFRSLPTIETRVSTSGPLPISVAPLSGVPIRPFSIGVRLARREHELARGDVHLAAAEVDRVDAALDGGDDLRGRVRPRAHVGIGHARQRHVRERLAPAVAGRRHAHEARVEAILHVAAQHAVLDERGAVGGRALVVDVERAAAARQRAVVHHRALGRGHALADAVRRTPRCPCG